MLVQPDLLESFSKQGATAEWTAPDDLGRHIAAEVRKWASLAKDAGLKPE